MAMLRPVVFLFCLSLAASPLWAQPRFPDPDPDPRVGTPNDPNYDCAEMDDPDAASCTVFSEDIHQFGFSPSATNPVTGRYLEVPADAARQGIALGDPQISGARTDLAWKKTLGRSDVILSVVDTGIRWDNREVRAKIALNAAELPLPQLADGSPAAGYDANGDGRFNVDDYADDARVDPASNPNDADAHGFIDAQDLIVAFSDGNDDDNNGYVDDIAGWDFFEDDNDPEDLTSYSAANGHGTGRAVNAAAQTNNGSSGTGVCPECQILPIREWDTFVVPGDNWAAATVYGADRGAHVQIMANGGLQNTRAAKAAASYAHEQGMVLMHVSSDLNTANHNYPTNYVETIFVNGCIADTETILGSEFGLPGAGDIPGVTLPDLPIAPSVPVNTWFRESNVTQHGAHAHICNNAVTGSESTGYAGGIAGMIVSAGLDAVDANTLDTPLSAYEVKQLVTLTAEDVLPGNTLGVGTPDPAQVGWDEYFGYGRANVNVAVDEVMTGRIPPEVLIREPAWWQILDPGPQAEGATVALSGRIAAPRAGSCNYTVEWAPGVSPAETALQPMPDLGGDCSAGIDGEFAQLPLDTIADAFAGSRSGGQTAADFNQYVFTVRVVATDGQGNRGEDRKTYFIYHDPSWHEGWPIFADTGGESSPVLYDLNGDGLLEVVEANSSGELWVRQADGTPLPSFNGGQPWQLPPTFFYHPESAGFAQGGVPAVNSGFRTPAIADVDGDFLPEIVAAAADGRVFVLARDGSVKFQVGVDPALSEPEDRTRIEHPKRGILGAPVIADLDPDDGQTDIVVAALDGHIYAWSGQDGSPRSGFPFALRDDDSPNVVARGELITAPAVADFNGDGLLEIVSGSSEVFSANPQPPGEDDIPSSIGDLFGSLASNTAGQTTRIYAIELVDGAPQLVAGWPVSIAGLLGDVLPFVGPQHAVAVGDVDEDGFDEVVASMTTGDTVLIEGDGSATTLGSTAAVNGGATSEVSKILNLFEYAVIGNLNNLGGLDIVKGGATAGYIANLALSGQNLPQNHVVQAWDSSLPESYLPGYPVATDDLMFLSTPTIADVEPGGDREIVVGNGLYLIHAYGALGQEAAGFPKLTGGWNFSVPAIGDIDGDGLLELASGTREGYRFVWDLDAPATQAANSEWWTEGHDECNSNNYGRDCRPPARITDLAVDSPATELTFTATGDDWRIGTASRYELFSADDAAINNPQRFSEFDAPDQSGAAQTLTLPDGVGNFVALVAYDDAGNASQPAILRLDDGTDPTDGGNGSGNNGDGGIGGPIDPNPDDDGGNAGGGNNGGAGGGPVPGSSGSGGGGGCVLQADSRFDPILPALLFFALMLLARRRIAG